MTTLTDTDTDAAAWADALIQGRRTVLPKRLQAPGPDAQQQDLIIHAAAAAPDHGQRLPWRIIEVPAAQRTRLAEVFAQALRERDPHANDSELAQAREKAHRAPWLMLATCLTRGDDPEIPAVERLVSAGCAIQNMLLMASALGYGSSLTSGKALSSQALRQMFGLTEDEDALCFINIGTSTDPRPGRPRPAASDFFRRLGDAAA